MGVTDALGYVHPTPNLVQRGWQRFGSTTFGAWFFSKTLASMDRIVHRLSNGRTSVPRLLAGLPVLMVTTRGRRSGQPRTAPLIAVPTGDDLALIGTNFGQARTPAWVLNLEADPHVQVEYGGVTIDATARPATADERGEIFRTASGVYPGYDLYQERITGRTIRVFLLQVASR